MSEQLNADLANELKSELGKAASGAPATYWLVVTNNSGPGTTGIVIPQAGTLWIYYGIGSAPAKNIYVWHQGGARTPIQPGENKIAVGKSDMIFYQLSNPASDSIKLGYQYV